MSPPVTPEEERLIFKFSGVTDNISAIRRQLKKSGYIRSWRTINMIINGKGKKRMAKLECLNYKCERRCPVLTGKVLRAIKNRVKNKDVYSVNALAKSMNIASTTFRRALKMLKLKRKKKLKVHYLSSKDKANRKRNSRKLYDTLRGSKIVMTLDESRIYYHKGTGGADYYYIEYGKEEESRIQDVKEVYPQNFMIVGSMSADTTFPLMKVPAKCTVDARYYIDHVLRPLVEKHLIPYYGDDIGKVVIHHDKAPAHTAKITRQYLMELNKNHGISFIEKEDIPVKGADISPLDFFGFGVIKQKLQCTRAKTEKGIWKSCRRIWSEVTPETCRNVFAAWKRRCRAVFRGDGGHVEPLKKIHRRKINK